MTGAFYSLRCFSDALVSSAFVDGKYPVVAEVLATRSAGGCVSATFGVGRADPQSDSGVVIRSVQSL